MRWAYLRPDQRRASIHVISAMESGPRGDAFAEGSVQGGLGPRVRVDAISAAGPLVLAPGVAACGVGVWSPRASSGERA